MCLERAEGPPDAPTLAQTRQSAFVMSRDHRSPKACALPAGQRSLVKGDFRCSTPPGMRQDSSSSCTRHAVCYLTIPATPAASEKEAFVPGHSREAVPGAGLRGSALRDRLLPCARLREIRVGTAQASRKSDTGQIPYTSLASPLQRRREATARMASIDSVWCLTPLSKGARSPIPRARTMAGRRRGFSRYGFTACTAKPSIQMLSACG